MTRKSVLIAIFICLAFAAGYGVGAYMQSGAGDQIPRNVIAGGGNLATAPSGHQLYSTTGQPVAGISEAANGTILVSGYHTMIPQGASQARNWEHY